MGPFPRWDFWSGGYLGPGIEAAGEALEHCLQCARDCGCCGAGIQAQSGRACLAGHCLTRARLSPFPYTHAAEMFQASIPSSLSQYNRKMPVWEIPSVGWRTKVNRNSSTQRNKSSWMDRLLITFTFHYRCIHFFGCVNNMLDIYKLHSILNFRDKIKLFF